MINLRLMVNGGDYNVPDNFTIFAHICPNGMMKSSGV